MVVLMERIIYKGFLFFFDESKSIRVTRDASETVSFLRILSSVLRVSFCVFVSQEFYLSIKNFDNSYMTERFYCVRENLSLPTVDDKNKFFWLCKEDITHEKWYY